MRLTVQSSLKGVTEVVISDSYGRYVYTDKFAGTTSISTTNFTTGMHYIILKQKQKVYTQKILVMD